MATKTGSALALTTRDLKKAFGVGHMTIYNWRLGTATKKPLPHKKDAQGHVSFPADKVAAWAKKHDLEFKIPAKAGERQKPGPAPTKKAAKKAAVSAKPARKSPGRKKAAPKPVVKKAAVVEAKTAKKLPEASPAMNQVAASLGAP